VKAEVLVGGQVGAKVLEVVDVAVEFELEQPFHVHPLVLEDHVARPSHLQQVVFEDLRNLLMPLGCQFWGRKVSFKRSWSNSSHLSTRTKLLPCPGATPFSTVCRKDG